MELILTRGVIILMTYMLHSSHNLFAKGEKPLTQVAYEIKKGHPSSVCPDVNQTSLINVQEFRGDVCR